MRADHGMIFIHKYLGLEQTRNELRNSSSIEVIAFYVTIRCRIEQTQVFVVEASESISNVTHIALRLCCNADRNPFRTYFHRNDECRV